MEHALVSGGAGFIGSHLCAALLQRGLSVICVDNFATGNVENLAPLQSNPHFRLVDADVTLLTASALALPADQTVAYVFHLASPASVVDYLRLPIETLLVNSIGTQRMLDIARAHSARFLLASTSEIYGDPLVHPQTETYWGNVSPNGPRSCYDESKRFGEALTAQYWRSYGVDTRTVRIFNTYGPHSRIDDGRVVPNFVAQALAGDPITVYGDGRQTRSFCYVSDLVAGLLAVMFNPGEAGEVFNLGNPEEHTILEFASIVLRLCNVTAGKEVSRGISWAELPVDDPTRRRPDITKARQRLGWSPNVSLEDGLCRTIEWFRPRVGVAAGDGLPASAGTRLRSNQ